MTGIIIAILVLFVGFLAVYNQIALKAEKNDIVPNGQMVDLGNYSVHVLLTSFIVV